MIPTLNDLAGALRRTLVWVANWLPGPAVTRDLAKMQPAQRAWHEVYREAHDV